MTHLSVSFYKKAARTTRCLCLFSKAMVSVHLKPLLRHESLSNEHALNALQHLVNGSDPEHPNFDVHTAKQAEAPSDAAPQEHERHGWLVKLVPEIEKVDWGDDFQAVFLTLFS
jgi:hypothetical protein